MFIIITPFFASIILTLVGRLVTLYHCIACVGSSINLYLRMKTTLFPMCVVSLNIVNTCGVCGRNSEVMCTYITLLGRAKCMLL